MNSIQNSSPGPAAVAVATAPVSSSANGTGPTVSAAPVDRLSPSGESGASQPHQDKATASVIAALPRACADGCGCPACSATPGDPAGAFKSRDHEVEQHEQAHLQEAGPDAQGAPTYETQMGPDGKAYRVGGHVNVSLKDDDPDPHQTVQRMQRIRRAALKPVDPSAQDYKVAGEAAQKETQAEARLSHRAGTSPGSPAASTTAG